MHVLHVIEGRIERRLLVNLRVDPDLVAPVLPRRLRPLTVEGWAVAGMCLIRLADLRPAGVPARLGVTTENVAHRIAVEWDDAGQRRTGVWVPQRDTSSRLTVALGGRAFPAVHGFADFDVDDRGDRIRVDVTRGGEPFISVSASAADDVPEGSVFTSLGQADAFFRAGATGVSPGRGNRCDIVDLDVDDWNLRPLRLDDVHATRLEELFPLGPTAAWDSAFVMRDRPCRWRTPTDHHVPAEPAPTRR